jgi:hypothetical protein
MISFFQGYKVHISGSIIDDMQRFDLLCTCGFEYLVYVKV